MGKISFKATQGVYLTYRSYPYKAPQVFGEFIDNSIQSFENNKNLLTVADPDYLLKVEINIEWAMDTDNVVKANKITIRDNAAGMTASQFAEAFDLANPRINRSGMNEYGVGMKAAASWLGNNWHVETTSITDNVTRVLDVDLTKITEENILELESKDTIDPVAKHGTVFIIHGLWPENAVKKSDIGDLIKSIASIYRYFIRRKEIQISIGEEILTFEDYEVLEAPSYKDLDGPDIKWTCPVTTDDRRGHGISGFVALLKDTADEKRGVVIMRNHRVVMGFDPKDRTIGKEFIGQIGSNKYRRVFGELEITGFKVAFGKNQVNDPGLLEALCKQAAGKLIVKGTNLLTQCDKYRKRSKKPTPTPTTPVPPTPTQVPTPVPPTTPIPSTPAPLTPQPQVPASPAPIAPSLSSADTLATGKFKVNSNLYQFIMKPGTESSEMFWNDLSQKSNYVLLCKVNTEHPFFKSYGKPDKQLIAMMKALSIAKFKSSITGLSTAINMMNEFNQIINTQETPDSND